MAVSLTQFGITINFSADVQTGTFANGDFWFLTVGITAITPVSGTANGWEVAHGAEINPYPRFAWAGDGVKQGFLKHDSVTWPGYPQGPETILYDPVLNVADGVSVGNPLVMVAGMSLITSIARLAHDAPSSGTNMGDSYLDTSAIFTCVAAPPLAGTFRPSPYGHTSHKDLTVNKSQIDFNVLGPGFALTTPNPGLTFIERHVERPWFTCIEGWRGKSLRGINNVARWNPTNASLGDAGYARGLCNEWGDCMLQIMDNSLTNTQKEKLMIGMLQVGLDHFGLMRHVQSTSTSTGAFTLTDLTQTWVTNEWVGATILSGASYVSPTEGGQWMVCTSNTATKITGTVGWKSVYGGPSVTPPSGGTYRLGCGYGWHNSDGGHGHGGKPCLVFAGMVLGRQDIIDVATKGDKYWRNGPYPSGIHFQEDGQFFHVEETRTGIYNWQSPFCDGGHATGVTSTTLVDAWKNFGSRNRWTTH